MAKKDKPKTNVTRNDSRKNGKAFKTPGASRNNGVVLTPVALVLLGKGMAHKQTRAK